MKTTHRNSSTVASLVGSALLLVGCATSGDLEKLGTELRSERETLKQELTAQAQQDREAQQSALEATKTTLESKLAKSNAETRQQIEVLQQTADTQRTQDQEAAEQARNQLRTELLASLEALRESLAAEQTQNAEELAKLQAAVAEIRQELIVVNKAVDLSRKLQNVQATFNDLKNRIEQSQNRLRNQNDLIQSLEGQVIQSERANLAIEQEMQGLEEQMKALLKLLEQEAQAQKQAGQEEEKTQETPEAQPKGNN